MTLGFWNLSETKNKYLNRIAFSSKLRGFLLEQKSVIRISTQHETMCTEKLNYVICIEKLKYDLIRINMSLKFQLKAAFLVSMNVYNTGLMKLSISDELKVALSSRGKIKISELYYTISVDC